MISATMTYQIDAPPDVYAARDKAAKDDETLQDFHPVVYATGVLEAKLEAARRQIADRAKKAGMTVSGDTMYGAHVRRTGSIELWWQVQAKS